MHISMREKLFIVLTKIVSLWVEGRVEGFSLGKYEIAHMTHVDVSGALFASFFIQPQKHNFKCWALEASCHGLDSIKLLCNEIFRYFSRNIFCIFMSFILISAPHQQFNLAFESEKILLKKKKHEIEWKANNNQIKLVSSS